MSSAKNLDGTYKAIGEELTTLAGYIATRLTATLAVDAVTAQVESTIDWPASGVMHIEGERIPYAGKTDTSFTGLTRYPLEAKSHPGGATVADGSRSYSQLDKLRADRLVTRAIGRALDRLAWHNGERRPLSLDDTPFQSLLMVLLYLDRGPWWALYRVLRAALSPWARTGTAGTDAGTPRRLSAAAGTFAVQDVGRPVEVNGRVYRVREVAADGSYIDLQPTRGYWWCAGNFGDGTDVQYTVQPFRIREHPDLEPGYVLLEVYLGSDRLPPPSYLLEGDPVDFTPAGWPLGMEILDDELVSGEDYDPWYLPGLPEDSSFPLMLEEVVPAGVDVKLNAVAVD